MKRKLQVTSDGVVILYRSQAGRRLHADVLRIVDGLIKKDPARRTPEGRLLLRLAKALERYEAVVYSMGKDK